MSVDEDNELRELVSQTLESNGILSKIRAELRANVFLALEKQDAFKDKPYLNNNKALTEFVNTSQGTVVMCLIREFLEFFGLEFTMTVFDPETQLGHDYEYVGRNKLIEDLKIKSVKKTPLLAQLLQNSFTSQISDDDDMSYQTDSSSKDENLKSSEEENKIDEKSVSGVIISTKSDKLINGKTSVSINGSIKPTERNKDSNLDSKQLSSDIKLSHHSLAQPNIRKPDALKLDINQSSIKSVNNSSLSSLGGLPPLTQLTNGQVGKQPFVQKDVSNDIKALLDQGLTDSLDNNYEEDFHSPTSDKAKKSLVSASCSEVEEEIESVGDDQTSTSGHGDDVTIDVTVSQASGHGDFLENI